MTGRRDEATVVRHPAVLWAEDPAGARGLRDLDHLFGPPGDARGAVVLRPGRRLRAQDGVLPFVRPGQARPRPGPASSVRGGPAAAARAARRLAALLRSLARRFGLGPVNSERR